MTYRIWSASTERCITATAEGDSPEAAFEKAVQMHSRYFPAGKYVVAIAAGPGAGCHRQFAVMERVTPVVVNQKVTL